MAKKNAQPTDGPAQPAEPTDGGGKRKRRRWGRTTTASATHTAEGHTAEGSRSVTVASATLISRDQVRRVSKKQDWQTEAWQHYENVGELGFAAQWIGRSLSRCKLRIAEVDPNGAGDPSPAEAPPQLAQQLLDGLYGGAHGEMLRRMGVHLTIPGETYLIGMDDPDAEDAANPGTRWVVASTEEFTTTGQGRARVRMPEDGRTVELDTGTATIIRLWQPHPRVAWEADSSVRFCRTILREISGLSQRIQADIDSRLAGAGVLAIPHSTTMPAPAQSDSGGGQPLHDDPFVSGLIQAMVTPIKDRDDASAVVPIVIKVPDEAVGKIQHVSFATDFDGKITELRDSAIRRFAGSADLPAEIITGLGDTNHWTSWSISDQAVSLHVEPLLSCVAQALTTEYLRPALRAVGEAQPQRWCIWYDTSELTQRPDRSTEAQALYEMGELGGEALLRENGFNPEQDAPDTQERLRWLASRVVTQHPELLPALAGPLGLDLTPEQRAALRPASQGGQITSPQQRARQRQALAPADSSSGSSRNEPPAQQATTTAAAAGDSGDQVDGWLLAAAEAVVYRALELSGKRLLNNASRKARYRSEPARQVHPWDMHTVTGAMAEADAHRLLAGAFDLADHTIHEPCVRQTVETYTVSLLCSGRPHRTEYLADMLRRSGCLAPADGDTDGQAAA